VTRAPAPSTATPKAPAPTPTGKAPASSREAPPAAPPPTPTGTAPAAEPGTQPDDPLADLRQRWPEVVALISRHPPTKPLIEACRPVSVDGATVTLGFPESQAFLRDVADRRKSALEEGLSRVLGRPVAVRCVATNLDGEAAIDGDPEGARMISIARSVFGADLVEPPSVD
jgi:hypothetical protein